MTPYLTIMNYEFDSSVDELISQLIDHGEIAYSDGYYVYFNTEKKDVLLGIWIQNKWYGFASRAIFTGHGSLDKQIYDNLRPSRRTMIRLDKLVQQSRRKDTKQVLKNIIRTTKQKPSSL